MIQRMLDYRKGCWGYEYVQEAFILIHFLDYDVRNNKSINYLLLESFINGFYKFNQIWYLIFWDYPNNMNPAAAAEGKGWTPISKTQEISTTNLF